MNQDKAKEIEFFDRHAGADEYNVFTQESNDRLIDTCLKLSGLRPPAKIADLGCGSGIFSSILAKRGFDVVGVDLSPGMIELAQTRYADQAKNLSFVVGDVEALPFESGSLDGVLMSGLLHHLPDPSLCIKEAHRVLKPGGAFAAFDPNRLNPFMYLYRDKSSPFYSNVGVTENERPVLAKRLAKMFEQNGFRVSTDFLSNLKYTYVASSKMRFLLPIYNFLDEMVFRPRFMSAMRAFVITAGTKKT